MTRVSPLGTMALLFCMTMLAGVFALTMLGSGTMIEVPGIQMQAQAIQRPSTIEWTGLGEHISIPGGMTVKPHANKHNDQVLDAWKIYALLLEGQCAASAVFCGPSDTERLYLCTDPSGRIGGLIVFGDEILTGYQGNQDYWARKVDRPYWEVCRD